MILTFGNSIKAIRLETKGGVFKQMKDYSSIFLRLALGISFLAAVADRFGLWGSFGQPNVAWGDFSHFVAYTGKLNWFMPSAAIPALAWAATCVEILLGVALVLGAFTRVAAFLSGWLLLLFALSMTFALGLKAPLNFSVFTASAAAFLLATCRKYSWSLDSLRKQPEGHPVKMQAGMPAIILMTVGVAVLGSWRLSATVTSNQAHETGKNTRVAISQTLPRMDGDHLEAKAIEVTYQPGASSPAHSHPCPVLAYVAEGTIRSQVNDEPERVYKVGETFYEAPNGVHRVSANASQTEPAKLIAFFVCDHEGPITVAIPASKQTNHK